MIEVSDLTLKYPGGKGIEDVAFFVNEGEVVGYLGPNGAGKTTTIRCLLGFSRPQRGAAFINGLDCLKKAPEIQRFLGYIPGEIAFLSGMSGKQFLCFLSEMRGEKNPSRMQELIDMFEIDTGGKIKKYSKGMKQKIGIIAAFMHDPQVIILDEPTSGLDPLMQNRFVELVLMEKAKGKTILMSSHIFEEVERTCDKVVIIKEGKIVRRADIEQLKQNQMKTYIVQLANQGDLWKLAPFGAKGENFINGKGEVAVKGEQIGEFIKTIGTLQVLSLESKSQSLEELFLNLYGKEGASI